MELKERGAAEANTEAFRNEAFDASRHLHASTRTVQRIFLRNGDSLAKLRLLKHAKHPAVARFEALVEELKGILFERLRQEADEEKEMEERLSIVAAREKKTTAEVKQLQEELKKARHQRNLEINAKNDIIRRLKDELRNIKDTAEDATKKTEIKSKLREEADLKDYAERVSGQQQHGAMPRGILRYLSPLVNKSTPRILLHYQEKILVSDIETLTKDLASLRTTHRDAELLLRKRNLKTQSEVENWIHKYDQDMGERQVELDDLAGQHGEERVQLDELREKHSAMSKEWERIQVEKKKAEERKKEEDRQLAVKVTAATKIQAIWRGFCVRRDIRKKKSKSGGKSGKKSAKKGKKK
ncbi:hypothetical protein HDU93_006700 [Gonapodya sp. JEL0774]|nr:hypothetical protein HDU93_006700 [Gonapodya sp. JEL0774]